MLKGIIFDLDGVITDTAYFHYLAWKNEVEKLGINFDEQTNEKLKGLNRIETLKAILKIYQIKIEENEIIKIANAKNEYYKKLLKTKLNETYILKGIKEFILEAKKNNLKLAIASSSFNAPYILKKINLFSYFDFIVDPSNIKKGKPDKEIFVAAQKALNLESDEVIGIEDSLSGIISLNDANIFSIAITNEPKYFKTANIILNNTSELDLNKILKIFKNR
ncbi:beta-phosphoglucomutase [[Mycoplasma] collis]|uniref:beta-phosphoglucomutase n=1 Tax=[Mycoplasma] collis TaxID=2127 RepID=UPI00051B04A8|nr:beta-phosphoglucomutase [[Mycoplasma] collis]